MLRAVVLALAVTLGACGSPGPSPTLPADVDAVLEARCRPCHDDPPLRYAPFPLVSWKHTQRPSPSDGDIPLFEMIGLRVADPGFPMPPRESPEASSFTPEERDTLVSWAAAGGPPAE